MGGRFVAPAGRHAGGPEGAEGAVEAGFGGSAIGIMKPYSSNSGWVGGGCDALLHSAGPPETGACFPGRTRPGIIRDLSLRFGAGADLAALGGESEPAALAYIPPPR